MRAGNRLGEPARPLQVGDEVLEDVEQVAGSHVPAERGFQRDRSSLAHGIDHQPVAEKSHGVRGADLRLAAVRDEDEAVGNEELRDGVLVVMTLSSKPFLTSSFGSLNSMSTSGIPLDERATSRRRLRLSFQPELLHCEQIVRVVGSLRSR